MCTTTHYQRYAAPDHAFVTRNRTEPHPYLEVGSELGGVGVGHVHQILESLRDGLLRGRVGREEKACEDGETEHGVVDSVYGSNSMLCGVWCGVVV